MNRPLRSLITVLAAVVAAACGQPQLIDRTQPNYVKKSDLLDGTWYIQESIVDAPKTPNGTAVIAKLQYRCRARFNSQLVFN